MIYSIIDCVKKGNCCIKYDPHITSPTAKCDIHTSQLAGTSYRIEIYFPVLNHLYILFSFVKRVKLCLVKYMISLLEIWKQSK